MIYAIIGGSVLVLFLALRLGISIGRKQGRRVVIWEFQEIIDRMIHFASNEQYRELHMFLHDLVDGDFRLRNKILEDKEAEEIPVEKLPKEEATR